MDGQMDRRTEKQHIQTWVPHLKMTKKDNFFSKVFKKKKKKKNEENVPKNAKKKNKQKNTL